MGEVVLRTGQGPSRTCRKVKWHPPDSKDKQFWFKIEWFLYTLLPLSTVDTMHYLSQTGNMLIYILDKAHTKCKNIMKNDVITK